MVDPPIHMTFPSLQSREEARAIIASFYPLILQQAGAAMLAQANLVPQNVLTLLR